MKVEASMTAISIEDERAAIPQHDSDGRCTEEFTHGVRQELTAVHTDDRLAVLLVGVTEALIDELLRGEGLDDTQPARVSPRPD